MTRTKYYDSAEEFLTPNRQYSDEQIIELSHKIMTRSKNYDSAEEFLTPNRQYSDEQSIEHSHKIITRISQTWFLPIRVFFACSRNVIRQKLLSRTRYNLFP
jgi:hypothetical protein